MVVQNGKQSIVGASNEKLNHLYGDGRIFEEERISVDLSSCGSTEACCGMFLQLQLSAQKAVKQYCNPINMPSEQDLCFDEGNLDAEGAVNIENLVKFGHSSCKLWFQYIVAITAGVYHPTACPRGACQLCNSPMMIKIDDKGSIDYFGRLFKWSSVAPKRR